MIRLERPEIWTVFTGGRNVPLENNLFEDDLAIDIVFGFKSVFDSPTTELLNAVIGGTGSPVAIATVVASLWWCHISTDQFVLCFNRSATSLCMVFLTRAARDTMLTILQARNVPATGAAR